MFIAPGGLGLLGGIALASQEIINPVWMTPLPFIVATIIHCIPQQLSDLKWLNTKREQVHLLPAVLSLLLFIVTVRSFCGFAFVGPWKLTGNSLLLLALASFLGKALGGFLGDQIGWRTFSGTILTLAAVACGFGYDVNLVAAFVAVFCIQATTGITLAGIQALFPGRPAFAFGIPCLALLVGAIPILFSFQLSFFSSKNAAMACFCAAIAGSYAFTIFKKRRG
ncbi:MAG: hypothetical protein KJ630_02080 [Proteobacteria bacterium]|nr:hypothetical protein [Pseudomonadota bacterium]